MPSSAPTRKDSCVKGQENCQKEVHELIPTQEQADTKLVLHAHHYLEYTPLNVVIYILFFYFFSTVFFFLQ